MARNTFVKKNDETQAEGIPGAFQAGARLLGELGALGPGESFPATDGYNLCYLKPDATMAVASADEYRAPWSAAWYRGLGRAAAITLEVDGQYSGAFGSWDGYADFLVTHARWLLGGGGDLEGVFVEMTREGQDAVIRVELDPERASEYRVRPPRVLVLPPGVERQDPIEPSLSWTGPNSLQARVRLSRTGTYRTLVRSGEREARDFVRGPIVTLPYSPEFVPRVDEPAGVEVLLELATLSGGEQRTDVASVFADPPRSSKRVSLLPWLFIASVVVLVLEIAGRRLSLWSRTGERFSRSARVVEREAPRPKPARERRRVAVAQVSAPVASEAADLHAAANASTAVAAQEPQPDPVDVFRSAKSRAKKRLK